MKVTVIVPIYNVEQYLRECLDSVISQTLADIVVICVNDGSIDKSQEILNEYSWKDARIKIINQIIRGHTLLEMQQLILLKEIIYVLLIQMIIIQISLYLKIFIYRNNYSNFHCHSLLNQVFNSFLANLFGTY